MNKEIAKRDVFILKKEYEGKEILSFDDKIKGKIFCIYNRVVKNKDYYYHLYKKDGKYEFSYYGKKNKYLCCPETKYIFYPDFYCVSKDNAACDKKEVKYYEY